MASGCYTLTASSGTGDSTAAEQQLIVTEAEVENPLADTAWSLLSYYDGQGDAPVLEGTNISAQFTADFSLHGFSGCNTYDTTYHVEGNSIIIGPALSTQILCDEAIMQQETVYMALFERAATYQIVGHPTDH